MDREYYNCYCGGDYVGGGLGEPSSVKVPEGWEQENEWDEQEDLAGEGQEDGYSCASDALEIVGCDDMETDDKEC